MITSRARTRTIAASAAVALCSTGMAVGASAAAPGETCTRGSAQRAIEAGIVAANHVRQGRTHTGIADAYLTCVYTLYRDGATYTFSEADTFAGMTAFQWWDWEADGYTRQQVNEIITAVEYTVLLAEVMPDGTVGEFVEQPLLRPPVKYHVMDRQGLTAYQTAGVVLDLDEGTYLSRFTFESPDFPEWSSTEEVTLVITPD